MSKIRIYEMARMLEKSNKEMMEILGELGVKVNNHMSSIDSETAQMVEDAIKGTKAPVEEKTDSPVSEIKVPAGVLISDVASIMGKKPAELVKVLVSSGYMIPADSPVNSDILEVLSIEFGMIITQDSGEEESKTAKTAKKAPLRGDHLVDRAPIITVMGHVDHGKTTLLDFIRKTRITETEAGGITQHIGASAVVHNDRRIVFLDTPGHEAFTAMRARGAQATDIVILVVAADDGVKPQTLEALNHAKASGVPIVVAVNKIDKPGSRPDRVRQQLSDHGLAPEEYGGDTVFVDVSAVTGHGIDQLLEMVLIVADMLEIKADPSVSPEGVVIEAKLDKGKGPVATVLVQQGTLRKGDIIQTEDSWGKIRAMIDNTGKMVEEAGPSTAVEVLGYSSVPQPGDIFHVVESEKEARQVFDEKQVSRREADTGPSRKITLEEMYDRMQTEEAPALSLVLKCDVQGSLEALKASLAKQGTSEVGINFIHAGVGRISESDVMLASASNAIIVGFNVRPDPNAKKVAEDEGVQIRLYRIIYDVIEDVRAALEGMLAPTIREKALGQAEIRAVFKIPRSGKVAGCYVTEGMMKRNAKVRLVRDGVVYWEGTLTTLKRFKEDAREVAMGYECGMSFANQQDFEVDDIVEAFELVEEKRTLD